MLARFGLRYRMAASYVLVSACAVLVVEAALLAVMIPRIQAVNDSIQQARQHEVEAEENTIRIKAEGFALETATAVGRTASRAAARSSGSADEALLEEAGAKEFGSSPVARKADGDPANDAQVLATLGGRIVASNSAGVFAVGSQLPTPALGTAPRSGKDQLNGQVAGWATKPVELTDETGRLGRVIGVAYARLVVERTGDPKQSRGDADVSTEVAALVVPGAVILVLLLPVGALFGLLSTGQLIRRIRRLAEGTSAMARGDLKTRLPVSGGDEVGRLEQAFNSMAERLDGAVQAERNAAGSQARQVERSRIARELHDSISQDLFSASMLAGGLRKALPAGSPLRHQAESLERSLERTKREMRAMLLELRPIALEDEGLAEALEGLCRAYEARLGIRITSLITPPPLDPQVEHAVLRVVQEALGNAVRHGEPGAIELRVHDTGGRLAVTVHDDGKGFDPAQAARHHGMGLELMRERVSELGGTFEVASAPDRGTTVSVFLPGSTEGQR
jgi:two-component system, NarL family, sensor histidine kinase LiaS